MKKCILISSFINGSCEVHLEHAGILLDSQTNQSVAVHDQVTGAVVMLAPFLDHKAKKYGDEWWYGTKQEVELISNLAKQILEGGLSD